MTLNQIHQFMVRGYSWNSAKHQKNNILANCRRFHQRFTIAFFVRKSFRQHFSSYILAKKHFHTKKSVYNVDEIDTWAQYHQRFTCSFYAQRARMRKKDSQVSSVFWLFWDLRWWNWHLVDFSPSPVGRDSSMEFPKIMFLL